MSAAVSPISHVISVATLPSSGRTEHVVPDTDGRAALARAHDLEAVDSFRAELDVRRWHRDGVRVTGAIDADVVQRCVVTLEPVPAQVRAPVDAVFVPGDSKLSRRAPAGEAHDLLVDPDGPDAPETFDPPDLDLGAIAEEFFALALDPYPRAAGVEPVAIVSEDDGDGTASPFAALGKLRGR